MQYVTVLGGKNRGNTGSIVGYLRGRRSQILVRFPGAQFPRDLCLVAGTNMRLATRHEITKVDDR